MAPKDGQHFHTASMDQVYSQDKSMIRYLKVVMKSQEENELYCTLTHLRVFGKSMHLSLVASFEGVNAPLPAVKEPELQVNAVAEVHDLRPLKVTANAGEDADFQAGEEGGSTTVKVLLDAWSSGN